MSVAVGSSVGRSSVDVDVAASSEAPLFQRLKPAIFKLLTALVKDNDSRKTAAFTIFLEFVQLLAFCFLGPWGKIGNQAYKVLLWTQLETRITQYDIAGVNIAMFAISMFLILCMLALTVYNVVSLHKSEFAAGVMPLRILRTLVSLLSSVLFLPVAAPLLKAIRQELYDDNEIGMWIIFGCSIAGVIFFVPFTLFMSLTYYNPNLKAQSFLARPNALLEFGEIVTKFVLLAVYVFTGDAVALGAVGLVCYGLVLAYLFFFVPYYNAIINFYRAALIGVLLWSSLIQVIVGATNNEDKGVYCFIAWAIVTPLAAGAFWRLMQWRHDAAVFGLYRQLVRQELPFPVDGGPINAEEVYTHFSTVVQKMTFSSPVMVELSTRFLHENHEVTDLAMARAIFDRGVELFPTSSKMLILSGIFNGTWLNQVVQWKLNLTKAKSMNPSFITEFLLHQQLGELRVMMESKITGKNINMVDSLELKSELRRCKRLHKLATAEILHFWKLLGSQKVDANRIQHSISKIANYEESGNTIFERLKKRYPKDSRILSSYARFLDDVVRNYRKADLLYSLAAANETEAQLTNGGMEVQKSVASMVSSDRDDGASVGHASSVSGARRSGISRKEIRQYTEYRQLVQHLRPSSSRRSTATIVFVVVLFIALAIGECVWLLSTVDMVANNIDTIRSSGVRRERAIQGAYRMRTMQFLARQENGYPKDLDQFYKLRQEVLDQYTPLYDLQKKLFFGQSESAPSFQLWLSPAESIFYNLTVFRGKELLDAVTNASERRTAAWEINSINQFDASSEFLRHMRDAALLEPSVFESGEYVYNPHYRFVMDNFVWIYGEGFNNATFLNILESETSMTNVLTAIIAAFGAMVAVLISVGLFIFRPMLNHMIKVRKQSLDVIFSIPKDMCSRIGARLQASTLHSAVDAADDEDEEEDDEVNNETGNTASIKVMYTKLTFAYVTGLLLIAAFFGISIGVNYTLAASLKEWGRRIDLTLQIRYIINRLSYSIREVTYLDPIMYLDTGLSEKYDYIKYGEKGSYKNFLDDLILHDYNRFNEIQLTLLFGNPEQGISRGRLPQELQVPMFTPKWDYAGSISSTDELVNMYLEDMLALMKLSPLKNYTIDNVYVQRALAIHKWIEQGFLDAADVNQRLFDDASSVLKSSAEGLMVLIIVGMLVIYQFVFRNLISYLSKASVESTKMLLLIPPEASVPHFELQEMLRGHDGAVLFFQDLGLEIPKKGAEEKSTKGQVKTVKGSLAATGKKDADHNVNDAERVVYEGEMSTGAVLKQVVSDIGKSLRKSISDVTGSIAALASHKSSKDLLRDEVKETEARINVRKSMTRLTADHADIGNDEKSAKKSSSKLNAQTKIISKSAAIDDEAAPQVVIIDHDESGNRGGAPVNAAASASNATSRLSFADNV